jgi:RNA chaperone Hfq
MEMAVGTTRERLSPIPQHIAELTKFRDERKQLTFTLMNGQTIEGAIRWFDEETIHLVTADRQEITLFLHAIVSYRT